MLTQWARCGRLCEGEVAGDWGDMQAPAGQHHHGEGNGSVCLQSLAESVYRCNSHGQFTYRSASLTALAMLFKLIESLGPTSQHSCLLMQQIWQLAILSVLARGVAPSDLLVGCVGQTLWFPGPSFSEMLVSGHKTYTELCWARRSWRSWRTSRAHASSNRIAASRWGFIDEGIRRVTSTPDYDPLELLQCSFHVYRNTSARVCSSLGRK